VAVYGRGRGISITLQYEKPDEKPLCRLLFVFLLLCVDHGHAATATFFCVGCPRAPAARCGHHSL